MKIIGTSVCEKSEKLPIVNPFEHFIEYSH